MKSAFILVLGTAAVASAKAGNRSTYRGPCDAGVRIMVARGTRESPGPGKMGDVAEDIAEAIPDSLVWAVDYPANSDYYPSVDKGVTELRSMIEEYEEACPDSAIALLGFSQGAGVIGDLLCGKFLGPLYSTAPPIPRSYVKNIVAVVTFGDYSHQPGLSWDVGTSERGGFPRQNTTACKAYAPKMRSYCDTGDEFCDNGGREGVHDSYFDKYGFDAFDFVLSKYIEAGLGDVKHETKGTRRYPSASEETITHDNSTGNSSETIECPTNLPAGCYRRKNAATKVKSWCLALGALGMLGATLAAIC